MKTESKPTALNFLTPEEIVLLHGKKFGISKARSKIREVRKGLNIKNRKEVTIKEYCEFFGFENEEILSCVK